MARLTNEEIAALARRELDSALGYDADTLASLREQALNYYNGHLGSTGMPQAEAGRSNLVSTDVRDVHGSVLSQILQCFKTSSIEFEPESEEDEDQAQLETDVVRLEIEKQGGDKVWYDAVSDALLMGTGWCKVWVQQHEEVQTQTFENYSEIDPIALDSILSVEAPSYVEANVDEKKDELRVRRVNVFNKLLIESVDPANMLYSSGVSQYDLQELRFVAERHLYTVAELTEDWGMSLEDAQSLPDWKDDYMPGIIARDNVPESTANFYEELTTNETGPQDATRLKECFHCYMLLDVDNSGVYERYHLLIGGAGGGILIHMEPFDHVPYVAGSPLPMPHRIEGTGLYQLLSQVQDAKTHTLRQLMDNLAVANSSRMAAVDGQVNMKDLNNGRINGVVRVKAPGMVEPLPTADVSAQAITGLEYLDKVRTSRGGASLDMNNSEMQIASSSAAAAVGEYTAKEKMATLFAQNMVNTIMKGVFLLVHRCMRTYLPGRMGAKIKGKWAETDPGQWQSRTHVQTVVGLSSQQRKEKIGGLQQLLQLQMAWLQSGAEGVLVSKSNIYNTAADLIRAAELGQPEQYLINPESEESMQAQQQISQQQQQMQQMAARMAEMEKQIEVWEHSTKMAHEYYDTNVQAGLKEAEMVVNATTEMEKLERGPVNGGAESTDSRAN